MTNLTKYPNIPEKWHDVYSIVSEMVIKEELTIEQKKFMTSIINTVRINDSSLEGRKLSVSLHDLVNSNVTPKMRRGCIGKIREILELPFYLSDITRYILTRNCEIEDPILDLKSDKLTKAILPLAYLPNLSELMEHLEEYGEGVYSETIDTLIDTVYNGTDEELQEAVDSIMDAHELSKLEIDYKDKELSKKLPKEKLNKLTVEQKEMIAYAEYKKMWNFVFEVEKNLYLDNKTLADNKEYLLKSLQDHVEKYKDADYIFKMANQAIEELTDLLRIKVPTSIGKQLNIQQLLTAYKLNKEKIFFNFSEPGAGKTLSFLFASMHYLVCKKQLIVCPSSVVSQWVKEIRRINPKATVFNRLPDVSELRDITYPLCIVLNYEKFDDKYDKRNKTEDVILELDLDIICLDEVHYVKNKFSQRTKRIQSIIKEMKKRKEYFFALSMSATPMVNNIFEIENVFKMSLGENIGFHKNDKRFKDYDWHLAVCKYAVVAPSYTGEIEMKEEVIEVDTTHRLEEMLNINLDYSAVEKKHMTAFSKIEQIHTEEKFKQANLFLKKGVLIFTHAVDSENTVDYILSIVRKMGYKAERYTGNMKKSDREHNLHCFIEGEIDILVASKSIATGIDGLQKRCTTIILNGIPWTSVEKDQLLRRIKRPGQLINDLTCVILKAFVTDADNIKKYSVDDRKLENISLKRGEIDAIMRGNLPIRKSKTKDELVANIFKYYSTLTVKKESK